MLKIFLKRTVLRNIPLRPYWWAVQRAVNNLLTEAFSSELLVSRRQNYRTRSAAELTPAVAMQEFAARANAHVVMHGSATTPIRQPHVCGIDPAQVRFCGPYFFYPDIGAPPLTFPTSSTSPPLTLSCLSDAVCLPDQVVLARDHSGTTTGGTWIIVDASFNTVWERAYHREIAQVSDDAFRIRRSVANFEFLPGHYLFLDCQHRDHFGHFLVDVMTLTWAYQVALELGIDRLKVLTTGVLAPYMVPLLTAMGIGHEAIVPVRCPIRCEHLLVASKCFLIQGYTSPVAVATWSRIRDAFDHGNGPERVYFSRSRNYNRHLQNEKTVEQIFAARGFRIIHPQQQSIEEQVTLWANVRLAAGPAGTNMFGLAFQRRLQRSLLINSPNMVQFNELLLQAGHTSETTSYIGRAHTKAVHDPWFVEPQDLEREVDRWLSSS